MLSIIILVACIICLHRSLMYLPPILFHSLLHLLRLFLPFVFTHSCISHLLLLATFHPPPINNLILWSNTGSLKLNNYPQPYPLSSIRRSQWKLGQTLLPLCVTLTRTLIITSEPVADTSVCFTVLGVVLESVYLSSATTCIKY